MRFNLLRAAIVVATTDHLDIAVAAAQASPFPVSLVDTWSGKQVPVPAAPSADSGMIIPRQAINDFLMQGRKIPAIKLVRELNQIGLAEAKAIVDRIQAEEQDAARSRDRLDRDW